MHRILYKLTVAIFLLFSVSNCTYWPSANVFIKDQLLNLINPSSQNSLNLLAGLFLLPSDIDTTPGTSVSLTSDNSFTGTWIDVSGDGFSDGIDLRGDGIPNILALDLNADNKPDSIDTNGDGNPEYFLNVNSRGGVLRTGANGSGNPVFLVLSGSRDILGFDTDSDGVPNDTLTSDVLKDKSSPTLSLNPPAGIYASETEIALQCNDDKAPGHIIYTLDASNPSFMPLNGTVRHPADSKFKLTANGDYTVTAFCRDLGGNVSSKILKVFTIDPNLPNIQIISQTSKGVSINVGAISQSITRWKSSKSGTYTLRSGSNSCNDGVTLASGNAIADTEYTFTRDATDFTGEGTNYYRICLNSEAGRKAEVTFSVYRDDTAPTVSASVGSGNYGTQPSPTLSCSDGGGSGCNGIVYTTNTAGVAPDPVFDPVTGVITTGTAYGYTAITMANLTTTSLKFQARDSAGNVSAINLQTYVVDSDLPVITVNSVTSLVKGTVNPNINWKSNKAGNYQLRIGGTDCTTGTAFTVGAPNSNVVGSVAANISRSSNMNKALFAEGDNTIRICFTTSFGVEGSITRTIHKDSVIPVVSIVSPTGPGPFPSGTQVTLQCTDTNGSGCKNIIYSLGETDTVSYLANGSLNTGTLYSSSFTLPDGLIRLQVLANDMALNLGTKLDVSFFVGVPSSPNNIVATGSGTNIFLEWMQSAGASAYTIYYSSTQGVNASSPKIIGITNPNVLLTGLSANTTYYFRVQAENSVGTGSISTFEGSALTAPTPMGLSATGSYVDISLNQGSSSGGEPNAKIDYFNQKLITATRNSANGSKPSLFICDLDGTNCTHSDISAGQANATAYDPFLVVDNVNQKLLIAGTNGGSSFNISLFRCDLDGTNCTNQNISGGTGVSYKPTLLMDSFYNKLIMVSRSGNSQNIIYSRCNLDGTNCVGKTLNHGLAFGTLISSEINATIDPISNKIVIVTRNGTNNNKPSLILCDLLGNNCTHTDVSSGQGSDSGYSPYINVDVINSKLLITTKNQALGNKLSLFRCNLDGSNCTHKDISSGIIFSSSSNTNISAKIDSVNSKLFIVGTESINNRPQLFYCDLDGGNEATVDISTGINSSGYSGNLVIDSLNARIAVVTTNSLNNNQLGLFLR
ncbi:MAG: chitobiase/beta-hexosaminidase C-terminal domain-containing protein [Leptospira sp.]|nr:chitobiase/beta-hexosaminidase C-terminal domain-containing protein [Leptospira sp.]